MISPTFDDIVLGRRSIRRYKPLIPPDEAIEAMVRAAMAAPSPSNTQPIRFIRLQSPHFRELLREAMLQKQAKLRSLAESSGRPKWMRNRISFYNRYMAFLFDAPVLMAVTTMRPKDLVSEQETMFGPELERLRIMNLHMTSGLAVMNYLLKGESLGLGSCIMSAPLIFLDEPEKLLGLEEMEMICFITTGYPDEEAKPISRKTMEEVYFCK